MAPERSLTSRGYILWPSLAVDTRCWCCPHVHGGEPMAGDWIPFDHDVVPMCMGVNRRAAMGRIAALRCPHVHGGEPAALRLSDGRNPVVPMCMGVNRVRCRANDPQDGRCPHVHGGEPATRRSSLADLPVVPMCMGVNRSAVSNESVAFSCPHVHGGEPRSTVRHGHRANGCPHVHGGEPQSQRGTQEPEGLSPCAWG